MKARTQVILDECIAKGAARGWRLSHKHVEQPTEEAILDRIQECIMSEIYECFSFDDDEHGII